MFETSNIMDIILDNVKKLFFPEDWLELDLKFSKTEIFTMLYLYKKKEATMTELVEYINSPMSTATGIIDRLVRSGHVSRGRSETDRRIVILTLTQEGLEFVEKLKGMVKDYIDMAIEGLEDEEKQYLINIALKIMKNMQKKLDSGIPGEKSENAVKSIEIE